jgi:hypothetical protein
MGKEEAGETAREGGGHASSFPLFSFFISNRGSNRCPISLLFERGQHLLPPCLFISFRTGAALAAPMSFHFISNGGSKCCPRVFSFRFEQGGSVNPTRCLHFSQF